MGTECESWISMYRKRDTYPTSMKITYWDEKYDWPSIKERKKGINDPVLQTRDAEQEQSRASKKYNLVWMSQVNFEYQSFQPDLNFTAKVNWWLMHFSWNWEILHFYKEEWSIKGQLDSWMRMDLEPEIAPQKCLLFTTPGKGQKITCLFVDLCYLWSSFDISGHVFLPVTPFLTAWVSYIVVPSPKIR